MIQEQLRIAGQKVACDRHIEVFNPFTNAVVGTVPKASLAQVREAFRIAQAYKERLSRFERANILNKAAAIVRERVPQIAALITAECGLSLKDSTYEAGRVADVLMFGANECLRDDGQIFSCDITPHGRKRRVYTQRDHALQPPDEPGGAQGGALGGHQQPHGAQALGEGAAVGLPVCRHPVRGRAAR